MANDNESVNPNTEVGQDTDNTGNDSSFLSFDEVATASSKPASEKKATKGPSEDDTVDVGLNKKKEVSSKAEKQVAKSESGDKKEKGEAKKAEASKTAEASPEVKKILAKLGEGDEASSLEIPVGAVVPVKIDGKEVAVPVSELLSNYSGKVAWDKRFTEIDLEKKAHEAQVNKNIEALNTFMEKSKTDFVGAAAMMAERAGQDGVEYIKNMQNQLLAVTEKLGQLSEPERKLLFTEQINNYLNQKIQSENAVRNQQQSVEQEQNDLLAQVQAAQETYGIGDIEQFKSTFNELYEQRETVLGSDREPTVDEVGRYFQIRQNDLKVGAAIEQVNPALSTDQVLIDAVTKMVDLDPTLPLEDVVEFVQYKVGTSKSKVNKSASKVATAKLQSNSKAGPVDVAAEMTPHKYKQNIDSDPMSFDDI